MMLNLISKILYRNPKTFMMVMYNIICNKYQYGTDVECIQLLKTIFYNSSIEYKEYYLNLKHIIQQYSRVVPVYRTSKAQYRSINQTNNKVWLILTVEKVLPL